MNFKKRISLAIVVSLIVLSAFPITASSAVNKIKMVINGEPADMSPIMIQGRVLVPLRSVSEALGAKVNWDNDLGIVEVKKGFRNITLNFDDSIEQQTADYVIVNGEFTELDVPAQVIKGKTYVPVRVIAEGLGADIKWDSKTSTVTVVLEAPKALEGLAATVRDAAYATMIATSMEFNMDSQFKIPAIPQLNMLKLSGSWKKGSAFYGNGHIIGWPLEMYLSGKDIYVKNQLFNNVWTNLATLVPTGTSDLQLETLEKTADDPDLYGYTTEVIRAFGDPKVAAEETVGGVLCQKIEFTPTEDSAEGLSELQAAYDELEKVSIVVWVGKDDQLMHKMDLRVDFMQENYMTNLEEPGFANIIAEFSDINKDLKIPTPDGIK